MLPDASLQQHIRAALLTKVTQPPKLPHGVMPPPALDMAALSTQQRHQNVPQASTNLPLKIRKSNAPYQVLRQPVKDTA